MREEKRLGESAKFEASRCRTIEDRERCAAWIAGKSRTKETAILFFTDLACI